MVSISLVLIAHLHLFDKLTGPSAAVIEVLSDGSYGVSIFFVISGFLITGLLLNEERKTGSISLARFYIRRALRILPPLYAYLLVLAMISAVGIVSVRWADLTEAATFITNYFSSGNWLVGHTWSLSIEEQFYLIWPLVFALTTRRIRIGLAVGTIALSPIVRTASYFAAPAWRGRIPIMFHTRADMLMFGCLLALLSRDPRFPGWMNRVYRWHAHTAAALLFFVILPPVVHHMRGAAMLTFGYTVQGLCIALFMHWATVNPEIGIARALNWKPIAFVGSISYSLYLWQQLFLAKELTEHLGKPLSIVLAFATAALSYFTVERIALWTRNRLMAGRPAKLSVPAPQIGVAL